MAGFEFDESFCVVSVLPATNLMANANNMDFLYDVMNSYDFDEFGGGEFYDLLEDGVMFLDADGVEP